MSSFGMSIKKRFLLQFRVGLARKTYAEGGTLA